MSSEAQLDEHGATDISERALVVKCGNKTAMFYPGKCKKSGKSVGKCIQFQGKWISPIEFESLAGIQAKKWKQSIKYSGKPLGAWISQNIEPLTTESQNNSQSTPNVDNHTQQRHVSAQSTPNDNELLVQHLGKVTSDCSSPDKDLESQGQVEGSEHTIYGLNSTQLSVASQSPNQEGSIAPPSSVQLGTSFEAMFIELEKKLRETILHSINNALEQLREHVNKELHKMVVMIESLSARVSQLERVVEKEVQNLPSDACSPQSEIGSKSYENVMSRTESIQSQVDHISAQVTNQQRIMEINDRSKRDKNVVIFGLGEGSETAESEVQRMLEDRLNINDIHVSSARSFGRKNSEMKKPRPILVVFESIEDKQKVMKAKVKLRGSNIYISHDLTKEQQIGMRESLKKKQFLIRHPDYSKKKITIFKGKLWADRVQITDDEIKSAGYSI